MYSLFAAVINLYDRSGSIFCNFLNSSTPFILGIFKSSKTRSYRPFLKEYKASPGSVKVSILKPSYVKNVSYRLVRSSSSSTISIEETHEWAIRTITTHKTRFNLESKMGKLTYLFRRYTRMSRCLIPINENYYLILTIDFDQYDFDKIIMEKILPLINKEKEKFFVV